jgi:hypothetical protein
MRESPITAAPRVEKTFMRNCIDFFWALLISALIMLLSGCERPGSEANKVSRVTSKVNGEAKLSDDRDNYCKREYKYVSDGFLQSLYRFEGNLPKISDSKIKRLQFVFEEWSDFKNDKEFRSMRWSTEMYPDPDYWQWKLQVQTKELIKDIENTLDWPQDREELLGFLRHIRRENSNSESEKFIAEWKKSEARRFQGPSAKRSA